jgi:phosphate-selective porin OprO/OprP
VRRLMPVALIRGEAFMKSSISLRAVVALAATTVALVPEPARAQAAAAAPQAAPVQAAQAAPAQAAPAVTAGFQDGFFIQTNNGDNRLVFGLVAQTDGRFSVDDPAPITDTFTIRKVRPTFTGRIARYFDFKVMPDFGNGTTVLQDAYFDIRFSPKFRVRSGKDKTPVGYELLEGDANLLFPERSLASSLVPNRDVGVQVQGNLDGNRFFYAGGVFNGIPDGSSSSTDVDTNNGKDLAGRIVVQPFASTATPPKALNGFGFQIGGSTGKEVGALPSFKTSVQQTYFSYVSTATANGFRHRVSPAVFYYYKSLGVFGEYMRSTQEVAKSGVTTEVSNAAWDVTGSILLTGEAATYGIVRPTNNFDPSTGHWGALQLLARYSTLKVDSSAFTAGLAGTGASREAKSFTVAANWYPAAYIKYYLTYEHTSFDNSAVRPNENVILFRTQLGF